jgi:hypothetical protein
MLRGKGWRFAVAGCGSFQLVQSRPIEHQGVTEPAVYVQ